MNTPNAPLDTRQRDDAFDARLRAIHAQAVDATPARVRLQLRPRSAAARGAHRGWSMAAAFAIGLVAVGLLWQRPARDVAAPAPAPVAATPPATDAPPAAEAPDLDEAYAALDESPDLYLWLGSSDASAMLDTPSPGMTPEPAKQ
jgi:hypothetical protein